MLTVADLFALSGGPLSRACWAPLPASRPCSARCSVNAPVEHLSWHWALAERVPFSGAGLDGAGMDAAIGARPRRKHRPHRGSARGSTGSARPRGSARLSPAGDSARHLNLPERLSLAGAAGPGRHVHVDLPVAPVRIRIRCCRCRCSLTRPIRPSVSSAWRRASRSPRWSSCPGRQVGLHLSPRVRHGTCCR